MHALTKIGAAAAITCVTTYGSATAHAAPPQTETPLSSIEACANGTRSSTPVLLVHGTNATVQQSLGSVRDGLLEDGRCVYGLDYDSRQALSTSAEYFAAAVERIIEINHTDSIELVGKSQGGLIARAVSLEFADRPVNPIKKVVAISGPQHGVSKTVGGVEVTALAGQVPGLRDKMPALVDMLAGSDYLNELNRGPMTAPGVRYTMIASRDDAIATPYTTAFIDAPNVTNIVIQDGCPDDHAGHLAETTDPRTIDLTLHALDPQRHPIIRCTANNDRR
ncbi:esterase/lipase family protein [Nocardia sp. CWNU-33]|uniref:esterase/lipase family protein n=1 Tax=Nocardia sp. CWNU-33 TaxID=3392117 RepID=UPI00398E7D4F